MEFCFKNILLIIFLQISIIYENSEEFCENFVINKNNKCKLKVHTSNHQKMYTCVCRDMNNVKLVNWTNSKLQTLNGLNERRIFQNFF